MLDIIKDLHLTVENIVAGIALISQNHNSSEFLRWEIKNGSNQPTVTISYKLAFEENGSATETQIEHETLENQNDEYSLKSSCKRNNSQSSENCVLLEKRKNLNLSCSSSTLEPPASSVSPVVTEEKSKFHPEASDIGKKIQKDSFVEYSDQAVEDENKLIQHEHSQNSSNAILEAQKAPVSFPSNDEIGFESSSSSSKPSSDNSKAVHPNNANSSTVCHIDIIKIKEEKDVNMDNFYYENVATHERTLDLIHTNEENQSNYIQKSVNCLKELVPTANQDLCVNSEWKQCHEKSNELIEKQERLLGIKQENTLFNSTSIDIFSPDIIIKTENDESSNYLVEIEHAKMISSGDNRYDFQEMNYSPFANNQDALNKESWEKLLKCHNCEKSFKQKRDLLTHLRIHTGEKPYPCSYCGKCFRDMRDRKRHERIHTGEKPYVCKYCSRRFARNHHKINHERTHSGEKPYSCKNCDKRFTQTRSLRVHEKNTCKKLRAAYRKTVLLSHITDF